MENKTEMENTTKIELDLVKAFQDGYNEGHRDGHLEGHCDGYEEGYCDGWNVGYRGYREETDYQG